MKHFTEQLDRLIKTVQQDRQVLAVFLFGSKVHSNNFKESDVDICLVMKSGCYKPAALSQKRLEYLKLFDMDIQVFQQLPFYIRTRIIKEGKILFCANEDELYKIVFSTIREFGDFEHIYSHYLKEVANVVSKYLEYLILKGMVEKEGRGIYRIADPVFGDRIRKKF